MTAPDIAARVPDLDEIVGFRDALVHRYWGLDDGAAWDLAVEMLPVLSANVQALLDELDG